MQKQDAGRYLGVPATQFIAHKHTSLLDFFTTSHKLFCLPSLMHVLIQRHSGHTGHKATHWGGEEGRAGDSLEPIKLFYGNQESMKLLYEAVALQVWTSYRLSQSNSTLKQRHGHQAREFQGTLAPGVRVAAQTHQVSGCREWLPVWGGTWSHAPSLYGLVYWFELWGLQVKPNIHHCLYMHRQK